MKQIAIVLVAIVLLTQQLVAVLVWESCDEVGVSQVSRDPCRCHVTCVGGGDWSVMYPVRVGNCLLCDEVGRRL